MTEMVDETWVLGFNDYVSSYTLHRSEGVLLRHLSGVYKVRGVMGGSSLHPSTRPCAHTEPPSQRVFYLLGPHRTHIQKKGYGSGWTFFNVYEKIWLNFLFVMKFKIQYPSWCFFFS